MDSPLLYRESDELRRKIPLAVIGGLCALLTYSWTVMMEAQEFSLEVLPLMVMGGLSVLLTLLDLRIGLGILIFAIGISPEFEVWGISNLRLEDFLFPVLLLSWLCHSAFGRQKLIPTDLRAPMLLTVLVSLFSTLYNLVYSELELAQSIFRLLKSIEYFFIFALALNGLRRREDLRLFAYLMPLVGALMGAYGLYQSVVGQGRITGPLGETSNILGGYYVLHICLAIGLIAGGVRFRPLLLVATLLMVVPLFHTMSRTSYIALFAGLLALFASGRNLSSAFILAISCIVILASSGISDRFLTIFGTLQGEAPNSLVMRVRGWMVFLDYLPQAPLLGQGVGKKALGAFDNEYVRQLFELGVAGLVVFLWMFLRVLKTSFRLSREAEDPIYRGFGLGFFSATAALLVHSLGATTFTTIRTSEPYFFAAGLLYGMAHLDRDDEQLPQELPPV